MVGDWRPTEPVFDKCEMQVSWSNSCRQLWVSGANLRRTLTTVEFLRFLKNESAEFGNRLIILAIAAGLLNGVAIAILIRSAGSMTAELKDEIFLDLAAFGLCFAAFYFCKRDAMDKTNQVAEGIIKSIRLRIAEKIRQTNLKGFEQIGKARFYSVVTTHIQTISAASGVLVNTSTAFILVVIGIGFICWLSTTAFVLSVAVVGGAIFYYVSVHREVIKNYSESSQMEDRFLTSYNDFLNGFADLKLNTRKSGEFFRSTIVDLSERLFETKVATGAMINTASMISQTAFFMWLASAIFLLPVLKPEEADEIVGISSVILFIFGPITQIVGLAPHLAQANVAISEIYSLERDLDQATSTEEREPAEGDISQTSSMEQIRCANLTYTYFDEYTNRPFTLGPVDFSINQGEVVFIRGGNGSGKSTFLKVLTCLYPADAGEIIWDGRPVTGYRVRQYRNLFAAVLADFHIFEKVYGADELDDDTVSDLLREMQIDDKTRIVNGSITNRALSSGQRKRLALIVARLEKKSVYVLDEWAAEQDPEARRKFYEEILPVLKREGKTLIVVTHDDRYYHCCDRVLTMEYGKFVNGDSSTPARR